MNTGGRLPVFTAGSSEIFSSVPILNPVQAIVRQEADKDAWRCSMSSKPVEKQEL
ncbi:hypothetical protein RGR602_PC00224 (plasmid) [Rhizobium gallicum bv. gallicum R602sp]|uniref:Uncharacterized protein n=1 Tax=Rhizobium gallicum bv. gallicum R602sp TaxID=1041138 RepID=A0A0B4X8C9_9HYPH|nr:hypothetical protein RGR602_PC00224 [Rhizobium gallicum bv. gallicum R602sp]